MVMSRYSVYPAEKNNSNYFPFCNWFCIFTYYSFGLCSWPVRHLVRKLWYWCLPSVVLFFLYHEASLSIVLGSFQNKKKCCYNVSFYSQQDQRSKDNISIVIADLGYLFKTFSCSFGWCVHASSSTSTASYWQFVQILAGGQIGRRCPMKDQTCSWN